MHRDDLKRLLDAVARGEVVVDEALESLATLPFKDLDMAMIDNHRQLRVGHPEIIYGEGKTPEQVATIVAYMNSRGDNVLVTRASRDMYLEVVKVVGDKDKLRYNAVGRTIVIENRPVGETPAGGETPVGELPAGESGQEDFIVIVAAGTSDLPVVEEAYETAKILGNRVEKVIDVGVAGIHRLYARLDMIRRARVIIVVAGMEGALASVLGGLVDKPIIAVPTSVGYGASFGGISALLTMLNSCASGLSVVNIDNGFGAAYCASRINQLK